MKTKKLEVSPEAVAHLVNIDAYSIAARVANSIYWKFKRRLDLVDLQNEAYHAMLTTEDLHFRPAGYLYRATYRHLLAYSIQQIKPVQVPNRVTRELAGTLQPCRPSRYKLSLLWGGCEATELSDNVGWVPADLSRVDVEALQAAASSLKPKARRAIQGKLNRWSGYCGGGKETSKPDKHYLRGLKQLREALS